MPGMAGYPWHIFEIWRILTEDIQPASTHYRLRQLKKNMVPHLTKCVYVAPDVGARAEAWRKAESGKLSEVAGAGLSTLLAPLRPPVLAHSRSWTYGSTNTSATPSPLASPLLLSPFHLTPLPPPRKDIRTTLCRGLTCTWSRMDSTASARVWRGFLPISHRKSRILERCPKPGNTTVSSEMGSGRHRS